MAPAGYLPVDIDWDGVLSCLSLITALITHVGYQFYHVLMFMLDFVGLEGLVRWYDHRRVCATFRAYYAARWHSAH